MAGAKKNGMVGMWGMTLLVVLLAASLLASPATARDPPVGLSIKGALWQPPSLRCCDNCRCEFSRRAPPCRCFDRFAREDGCPRGCFNCAPNFDWWTFTCLDSLVSCPRRCSCRSPAAAGTASAAATTCAGAGDDAVTGI